jgi:hypothetical protein
MPKTKRIRWTYEMEQKALGLRALKYTRQEIADLMNMAYDTELSEMAVRVKLQKLVGRRRV